MYKGVNPRVYHISPWNSSDICWFNSNAGLTISVFWDKDNGGRPSKHLINKPIISLYSLVTGELVFIAGFLVMGFALQN